MADAARGARGAAVHRPGLRVSVRKERLIQLWSVVGSPLGYGILMTAIEAAALFG